NRKLQSHPEEASFTVNIERRGSSERIRGASGVGSPFDFFDEENSPERFLTGYGATRRVEMAESVDSRSHKRRIPRYQRVAGLFEEYVALMPLGTWLAQLKTSKHRRFKELIELIDVLLPDETSFEGHFEGLEALFLHQGVQLPFGALSDGYRAYIGL